MHYEDSFLREYCNEYKRKPKQFWDSLNSDDMDFLLENGLTEITALNLFLFFYKTDFIKNLKMMKEREDVNSIDIATMVSIADTTISSALDGPANSYRKYSTNKSYRDGVMYIKDFLVELSHKMMTGSREYVDTIFDIFMYSQNASKEVSRVVQKIASVRKSYPSFFDMFEIVSKYPDFSQELRNRLNNQILYESSSEIPHINSYAFLYAGVHGVSNEHFDIHSFIMELDKEMFIKYLRIVLPYNESYSYIKMPMYDNILSIPLINNHDPYKLEPIFRQIIGLIETGRSDLLVMKDRAKNKFINSQGNEAALQYTVNDVIDIDYIRAATFVSRFDLDKQNIIPDIVRVMGKNVISDNNEGLTSRDVMDNLLSTLSLTSLAVKKLSRSTDDPQEIGDILYKYYRNFFFDRNTNKKAKEKLLGDAVVYLDVMSMMTDDGIDIETIKLIFGLNE